MIFTLPPQKNQVVKLTSKLGKTHVVKEVINPDGGQDASYIIQNLRPAFPGIFKIIIRDPEFVLHNNNCTNIR